MKKSGFFLFLILVLSFPLLGADTPQAEEYTPEEFPGWVLDLRRGETIFFGSLPFTFFFTFEAYDIYRYLRYNTDDTSANDVYGPWPVPDSSLNTYTLQEKTGIIFSAVGLSVAMAVTDYLIGRMKGRDLSRREE